MSHYRSNLRDIRFTLYELLGRDDVLGTGPWADLDRDAVNSMLDAGERLATDHLATSFSDLEHGDVHFDPVEHRVTLPEAFKVSYQRYADAEWWRMDVSEELGGIAAPASVRWAMAELALGANPAAFIYAAGWTHAQVLHHLGTPEQQQLAQLMVDRRWGATMVLTEPDAGSAVGSGRTRAIAQPDGSWHLEGVKRFITSADHDLSDNIVHFVLARPVDTPGAGGPGTKGLSMFVVPKHHVDLATGELLGRNGVDVTNVEHKMGLRVSATCELTFGADTPAVGWLVGDVHDGIAQMFHVVEYARMLVGVKAMATLSTGYLNALDYARERLQGPDLADRGNRSAPDVPIIQHPDVRASLLRQKAYAEGLRALALYTASQQDQKVLDAHAGRDGTDVTARNELLLPIVKGFSSERAYELLADSLQVFGGSGYLQDYPVEQYIRDAKIDTVYEGTTAIQGLDFFYRKIVRDDGRAFDALMDEIDALCSSDAPSARTGRDELASALAAVRQTLKQLRAWQDGTADDRREAYRVGLQATRFLMMTGELVVGWLLARQADVAEAALASTPAPSASDASFYRGKVAAARFFAENQLPLVVAQSERVLATTLEVMDLQDADF